MISTTRRNRTFIGVAALSVALVATGCGGDDETAQDLSTEDVATAEPDPTTTEEPTDGTTEPQDEETQAADTEDTAELAGAEQALRADLEELNASGAAGVAQIEVADDQVLVTVQADGLAADLPHAQHIHIGGENTCPTMDDSGDDDILTVPEGASSYGEIAVSLTTEGETDPGSALAVDRFPTADGEGTLTYSRTFDLPEGTTASDLTDGVIVVHGVADTTLGEDPDAYDGPDSELQEGVPQEATLPALCGALESVDGPTGSGSDTQTGTETETEATG